jgi:maleylacetoacetate isomerase
MLCSRLTLYSYFRSSAAYRVRIALNFKNITHEIIPVHLVRGDGEHKQEWFRSLNPQMRVPTLAVEHDGERHILGQSIAIIEYLEEVWPSPALLPRGQIARAKVRAVAAMIACDIHPLNNSGTLGWLKGKMKQDQEAIGEWYSHWITTGFEAIEALIKPNPYAFGDTLTLADICLVPQVYNARRFKIPIDGFPRILAATAAALDHPAVRSASPDAQPDAE